MNRVWLDDETFSPFQITNGVDRYAEGVEIMIRALALDDGPVLVRDLTPGGQDWLLVDEDLVPAPPEYVHALDGALEDDSVEVWAQNSRFDRTVERVAGLKIPLHRWRDTMVQAMAHGLPGKLEQMCQALKLPEDKAKDKAGKALIQLFCKPQEFKFRKRNTAGGEKPADYKAAKAAAAEQWAGRATRDTHPAEWRQFLIYAGRDIVSMRAASKIMPMWNYRGAELALWQLDQRINDRGAAIDLELAECAVNAVDAAQIVLREKTQQMTGYDPETGEGVESATQRDKMLEYLLAEYGVDLPDMKKDTLERRIADPDIPESLRELLRVRLQASTSSTSKYRVLLRATSSDGRLRGLLQFCGASRTGRWAGRLFQPQNLPSRGLLPAAQITEGIAALKAGHADLLFDNVMKLTSSTIRGCIIAPPGRKLVVADLSNIEGRVVAWLAGEQWKLKAFREFDTLMTEAGEWISGTTYYQACLGGTAPALELDAKGEPVRRGPDLYKLSYSKSFGVSPADVSKEQRQIGKVQELMLAYQGGVGAYMTGAATYGIDLEDMAEKAHKAIPGNIMGQARIMLEWHQKHGRDPLQLTGLSERAWLVCEAFVLGWREAHPNVAQFWKDLDASVREAITNPGTTLQCGRVRIRRDGAWLRLVLPSGRALCYPSPALVPEKKKKSKTEHEVEAELEGDEPATGRTQISYMGMNQYSRKWERIRTYGGMLAENCIAEGTEVLTERGWQRIEQVTSAVRVWDGVEWVNHDGCVYNGKHLVLQVYGVTMTPDHRVLTEEGWKNASSCEGLNRAAVGLPDGYPVRRGERQEIYVGNEMPLRPGEIDGSIGVCETAEAGRSGVLRLHEASHHCGAADDARHEPAPGVCGVAQHDRPLPLTDTPGVSQLRCAGHRGLQALARFVREFLGRLGADVSGRANAGAPEQLARVHAGQLPVGVVSAPSEQQTHFKTDRHPAGPNYCDHGRAAVRDRAQYAGLAPVKRMVSGAGAQPVYDLINCGPRNRFVVRGSDGPLIVHNCAQAVARDVMAANMHAIEEAGYEIILTVHDEVLTEAPDHPDWNPEHLAAIMARVPDWAEGLPLAAAGFEADRYRKD